MVWKPIAGTDKRYEVSADGRVRSWWYRGRRKKPRILKNQRHKKSGYLYISLCLSTGEIKRVAVHTLVLTAFQKPKPDGKQCRHLNGRPEDNRLSNLRWGTKAENEADKRRHGRLTDGERNGCVRFSEAQIEEVKRLRNEGCAVWAIAHQFGMTENYVSRVCGGHRRKRA